MAELCKQAGFADCENLVQRDLLFLCERIEDKTGVLISLSTIKRLLNGQFSRLPQIATLDAIALFLGYANWQGFKVGNGPVTLPSQEELFIPAKPSGNRFLVMRSLVWVAPLVLITIGLLAIMRVGKHGVGNIDKARFSAVKVTGNDLPNTVIFTYNIDSVAGDSFFIQQSWDKNRRVRINKGTHTLTDIYLEPGYHTAKLIVNDEVIKTAEVSIPTDRWLFYAQKGFGGKPSYIDAASTGTDGGVRLTPQDLEASKIDISNEGQYTMVYFPSRFENSSDNFTLKFRIKVNPLGNELCPYFMTEVCSQRYFMYFKSTLSGCVHVSEAEFGDTKLIGKTHDLSALGTDVRKWQRVELLVKDKKVAIRINDNNIFSTAYTQSCGLVTGLSFISNGLCEVDSMDFTANNQPIILPAVQHESVRSIVSKANRQPGKK